jgi:hypothetical protein
MGDEPAGPTRRVRWTGGEMRRRIGPVRAAGRITKVEARTAQEPAPIRPRSSHGYASHYFIFGGEGSRRVWGVLEVTRDSGDRITFSQTISQLNRPIPQVDIDATRPVMALVERRLESQCDMQGLARRIVEQCDRVRCDPLPRLP